MADERELGDDELVSLMEGEAAGTEQTGGGTTSGGDDITSAGGGDPTLGGLGLDGGAATGAELDVPVRDVPGHPLPGGS